MYLLSWLAMHRHTFYFTSKSVNATVVVDEFTLQ